MSLVRRAFMAAVATSLWAGSVHAAEDVALTEQEQRVVSYFSARGLQKFMMMDKARGEIMAIDRGAVILKYSALSGKEKGDYTSNETKVTPAGFFDVHFSPDQTGVNAYMQFNRRADYSIDVIHPTINVPGQNRAERIASNKSEFKRISSGCINVALEHYQNLSAFAREAYQEILSADGKAKGIGTFLVVLPENAADTGKILGIPDNYKPSF